MLIPKDLPNYHSYLLRFWTEDSLELADAWRFSLEEPQSGMRRGFVGLAELVSFLEQEVDPHANEEDDAKPNSNRP